MIDLQMWFRLMWLKLVVLRFATVCLDFPIQSSPWGQTSKPWGMLKTRWFFIRYVIVIVMVIKIIVNIKLTIRIIISINITTCCHCFLFPGQPAGEEHDEPFHYGQHQWSSSKSSRLLSWLIDYYQQYRVIKSNCHKQYLSEEPKNCKKWPNPMIFRKFLCGGFGILMSHNDQVEQIFHFTVLPKWWDGFSTADHWVRPFFAIFRLIREILFVTVAFDHPVVQFKEMD